MSTIAKRVRTRQAPCVQFFIWVDCKRKSKPWDAAFVSAMEEEYDEEEEDEE